MTIFCRPLTRAFDHLRQRPPVTDTGHRLACAWATLTDPQPRGRAQHPHPTPSHPAPKGGLVWLPDAHRRNAKVGLATPARRSNLPKLDGLNVKHVSVVAKICAMIQRGLFAHYPGQ